MGGRPLPTPAEKLARSHSPPPPPDTLVGWGSRKKDGTSKAKKIYNMH